MAAQTLPPFPVTDDVLNQVEHALGTMRGDNDELVGGEFTMPQLLDFLSGYDESLSVLIVPGRDESDLPEWERGRGGIVDAPIYEYRGGSLYTRDCVIRALIAEVRRLRSQPPIQQGECPCP